MKIKGSPLFLIFVIVLMLVMIFSAIPMKYSSSKMMPIGVGCVVIVLAAIELRSELKAKAKEKMPKKEETKEGAAEEEDEQRLKGWPIILFNLAWLAGFVLLIYLLGFLIAIPLFLLIYMKWLHTRWLTAVITAVVVVVAVYFIFEVGLKFRLPPGLIIELLGY